MEPAAAPEPTAAPEPAPEPTIEPAHELAASGPHRRPRRAAPGIQRLPFRRLVNPFEPLRILSDDQVESIHHASLRILSEIGVECLGDSALDAFERAGAMVDRETRKVRLDPAQAEELVALAPAEFTLHARNPERSVVFGGRNLVFGSVGGPAFASDLDRGRRAGSLIIDAEILQMMSEVLQPLEVSEATLGLDALADVGPGGHFFGSAHTLERYETAFYRPIVSDWRNFETWEADGARTATQRANIIWKRLLAEAVPPPLDLARAEELDAFVERRKREIAAAG